MGSSPHLKNQDSKFTTCFPEPTLSRPSSGNRVGALAVDNVVIGRVMAGGFWQQITKRLDR